MYMMRVYLKDYGRYEICHMSFYKSFEDAKRNKPRKIGTYERGKMVYEKRITNVKENFISNFIVYGGKYDRKEGILIIEDTLCDFDNKPFYVVQVKNGPIFDIEYALSDNIDTLYNYIMRTKEYHISLLLDRDIHKFNITEKFNNNKCDINMDDIYIGNIYNKRRLAKRRISGDDTKTKNIEPLTQDQIKKLRQGSNGFDWKVSEEDILRAICTHKDKNGVTALTEVGENVCHCSICGGTFRSIVDSDIDKKIDEIMKRLEQDMSMSREELVKEMIKTLTIPPIN